MFKSSETLYNSSQIDINAKSWEELPAKVQEDLLTWFNVAEYIEQPMHDPSDPESWKEDKARLLALYVNGHFRAWDCPECEGRVFCGNPDDWSHFQGVRNQDFASYPGDSDKYTAEYISAMCDECRCG